jgi:hypothetical protein
MRIEPVEKERAPARVRRIYEAIEGEGRRVARPRGGSNFKNPNAATARSQARPSWRAVATSTGRA